MPQLHETTMGQKFFNVTAPALVRALNDIAGALKEHNNVVRENTQAIRDLEAAMRGEEKS